MNAQVTVGNIAALRHRYWPSLFLAMIAFLIAFIPLPAGTVMPAVDDVHIAASQYQFSPGVVTVNQGDLVMIELESTDVVHGLYLDGYDLEIIADPGQPSTLSFVADKSGTFRFRCSVTCGPLHPFMIGKLKVGNNTLLWRGMALSILVAAVVLWRYRS